MDKYDEDHDGCMPGAKYKEIMGARAEDLQERIAEKFGSAEAIFEKCDTNKDGIVSEEEFIKCTTKELGVSEEATKKMYEKAAGDKPLTQDAFTKEFGIGKDEV